MALILRRLLHHCWLTFAGIIICAAILLSIARGLFAYANNFRGDMLQWLTGYSTKELQIGQLSASIYHFRPVLVFKNMRFHPANEKRYQLKSRSVILDFNMLASLQTRQVVFRNIRLQGVQLSLPWVNDYSDVSSDSVDLKAAKVFADLFLRRLDNFQIQDAKLSLFVANQPPHILNIQSMRWRNHDGLHQGEGSAYLPHLGQPNSTVHFAVQLNDDHHSDSLLNIPGRFYASGRHLQLARIGELFQSKALTHLNTDLNFNIWGSFGGDKPLLWQWQWLPSSLHWESAQDRSAHQINIDGGQLALRRRGANYQVDSDKLLVNTDGVSWGPLQLQGILSEKQEHWYLNQISLAPLAPLFSLFSNRDDLLIPKVASGQLRDIQLGYQWAQGSLSYQAQLDNFSMTHSGVWPGVTNLAGHVSGDDTQLNYQLQINQGKLVLQPLFDSSWPVTALRAKGSLNWSATEHALNVDELTLDSPWVKAQSRGRLSWQAGHRLPWLSISSKLDLLDAKQAHHFYPSPLMPKIVADYLQKAIQGGQAQDAKMLWYGDLAKFPYREPDGIFQAFMPLRQATFKFQPDWPALKHLDIDLLFQNESLHMESKQSTLADVPIQHVNAAIETLRPTGDVAIHALLDNVSLVKVHQLLEKSPVPALAASMKALPMSAGGLSGRLFLKIPLNGQPVEVAGDAKFNRAKMSVASLAMNLANLNGQLNFQDAQLRAHGLNATWDGQPLSIDLNGDSQPSHYQIGLGLQGRWDISALQRRLSNPHWLAPASGQLNWQGDVNVSLGYDDGFNYNAKFHSGLTHLTLALPKPLTKSTQQWPATLYVSGNERSGGGIVSVKNKIYSRFRFDNTPFHLNALRLNVGNMQTLPQLSQQLPSAGSILDINVDQAPLEPWLGYVLPLLSGSTQRDKTDKSLPSAAAALFPPFVGMQLQAKQVNAFAQPVQQVKLIYQQSNAFWQLQSKQLNGQLVLPVQPSLTHPWQLNIQQADLPQLNLSALTQFGSSVTPVQSDGSLLATPVPVSINCQSCQFGRYHIGTLKLWLPFANGQMKDGQLSLRGAGKMKLDAKLNWLATPSGMRSFVQGTFATQDSGKYIESLGFTKELEQAPLKGSFDLNWLGLPYHPEYATLNGKGQWSAGEGVLTDVSDKGTRLFTLASLDTLRRRLKLDFRDIFDKGLYFNSAKASMNVTNGVVKNSNFYMDAVPGVIHGKGQVDLNSGLIHYRMSFSPKIASSLPVLAAFAVTPITGAAVLALSKLFEPMIEVITQVDFDITGNVDHPKLIEVKREHGKVKLQPKQLDKQR
ncbi:YhdP family protein [Celerinatantimonas yamalensis]|uniref:YhdP family protein n=1 Tax=Celerinatantimonas yamalensis TaxID=559956 RepID=A0ABW9GC65_9GAMM